MKGNLRKLLSKYSLSFIVFITGACVLVIEITAIRILAPYFGNTIFSVSSVISVVLAALSVGYWFGGRLADKRPSRQLFYAIIAFSGIAVLFIQFLKDGLLPLLGNSLPLTVGPLVVSCLLFFAPSFILGMLSPFAVSLQQKESKGQGVGTTAGQIFFFSTLGSIAGSLSAGFLLIPYFGLSAIVAGVGVVLFLLGFVPLIFGKMDRTFLAAIALAASGLLFVSSLPGSASSQTVYSHDGVYEKIDIRDGEYNGRPTRFLTQDTSSSAAMYLDTKDDSDLVFEYSKYYKLYQVFSPEVDRALVIGGGAYSIPKVFLKEFPNAKIDVSEIEPSLVSLSEKYFNVPKDPRLTSYIEDGRRMLKETDFKYDLIFGDAYRSMYSVPYHLTTKEFMQLVYDKLSDRGVFMANIIGRTSPDGDSFLWSEVKTIQQIFPQVYLFPVDNLVDSGAQNIIVIATKNSDRINPFDSEVVKNYPEVVDLLGHYLDTSGYSLDGYSILSDDYAPIDHLVSKILPKR